MWHFMTWGKRQVTSVGCEASVSPCCDSLFPSEEDGLYILSSRRSSEATLLGVWCPGWRSQRPGGQSEISLWEGAFVLIQI